MKKAILTFLLLIVVKISFGQITIEGDIVKQVEISNVQIYIPIEIDITSESEIQGLTLNLKFKNSSLSEPQQKSIISNSSTVFNLENKWPNLTKKTNTIKKTIFLYLEVPAGSIGFANKYIEYTLNLNGVPDGTKINIPKTIRVEFIPTKNLICNLNDYFKDPQLKLDYVSKIEANNNIFTLNGKKNGSLAKRTIVMKPREVLALKEWRYLNIASLSLTTIPFKVRRSINAEDSLFRTTASSGLTNLGFNINYISRQTNRYFANGTKSTHSWALGFWAAPSVEELDSVYTRGYLKKDIKTKQLFISAGFTIGYSYNDVTFLFVPWGWDLATTPLGKKWIYRGQSWWGFGIGLSPTVLAKLIK
jgi:hypothetical protein